MQMKIIITFFVIICSIGLASINDAYATADTWTDATTTNVGNTNMRGVSMGDASNGVAVWVSEDRITLADMIVSIEHLINN